jgi:hypothetical protein
MDEKSIPKRILESKNIGKRPVGKPKKRLLNVAEIDSREILNVRNCKRDSVGRQIWRRHLKETKVRLWAV